MPFEKGRKKTGGKQKGAKDKKTIAWENIGSYLINEGANRAKEIMMNSNDRQFMFYFETLLEYFKPKLARTEIKDLTPPNKKIGEMRITIVDKESK